MSRSKNHTKSDVVCMLPSVMPNVLELDFPVYAQPKIAGIRCLVSVDKNGSVKIVNKEGKALHQLPLLSALDHHVETGMVFDGVLSSRTLPLHSLTSLLEDEDPDLDLTRTITFICFDTLDHEKQFSRRWSDVYKQLQYLNPHFVVPARTTLVFNSKDLTDLYENYVNQGYEGIIVRTQEGKYVLGESDSVFVRQDVEQAEFVIENVCRSRSSKDTHIAICSVPDQSASDLTVEFECQLSPELTQLDEIIKKPELVIGKRAKLQFQGFGGPNRIPRLPVVIKFIDPINSPSRNK